MGRKIVKTYQLLSSRFSNASGRIPAPKLTLIAPILLLILASTNALFAQTGPSATIRASVEPKQPVMLIIDGKIIQADSIEFRRGQQVMVRLRDLDGLGWGTTSMNPSGEYTFTNKSGQVLTFAKGSDLAKINELSVTMAVDTYLKDGKLMVPLSFVAKALGYEYDMQFMAVAEVITKPELMTKKNSIEGVVTYAGRGIGGVIVRAVDSEFKPVKNMLAKTSDDGSFKITGLPDGNYMAYVYVGDNPQYFNRASEVVAVKNNLTCQVKNIPIGRILAVVNPKPESKITPSKGRISVEWTNCPLSASYEVVIRKSDSLGEVYRGTSKKPTMLVPITAIKPGIKYEISVTAVDSTGDYLGGTVGAGGKAWSFQITKGD